MNWNPEDYKTYWLDWEDDNGGWREDNFVMARDYEDLLEMYKAEKQSKSARVVPFRDGYQVFTETFSFFAKPPKEENKQQSAGHIGPRPLGYKGNWR